MEHRLVSHIEKALGWDGPGSVGTAFARGRLTDPELPARLLTPLRLLDLIKRRHLANPQLRCYAEGDEVHPSTFLSTNVNRRRQAVNQADMAALGRILNDGGTVVLDHVDFFDPTLEVTCRALGWWSGELTSANAYLAVGDTDGFHLHWDDHEVIAVQLSGEKSWEVRGPSRPAPMYRDAERNRTSSEEVLWKGTMRAGDVMHIPRGFWHTATRLGSGSGGHSLHVTFGFTDPVVMTSRGPPWSRTRPMRIPASAEMTRAIENAAVVARGPAGGGGDLGVQDGEGVVDDSPAGDLGGAQGGQGGPGPRPVPRSGRGPVDVEVGHRRVSSSRPRRPVPWWWRRPSWRSKCCPVAWPRCRRRP
ncbi:cupin domain-containing protein [Streptomyces sp. NPDC019645]|uniref:JmjC domain-containing protein n=1 Tax=Streptomyces sp. NPDC019645 TaxID=3154786 RepID=UPI003401E3D1